MLNKQRDAIEDVFKMMTLKNAIASKVHVAQYMQVPINYVLYETQGTAIQLWITREFVKRGYPMLYAGNHSDKYKGCFLKNID